MKKLDDLMGDAVGHQSVIIAARAQLALKNWPEAVGELLAENVIPDRYDHGVLYVTSESSAWAQEVVMQRRTILKRLNELSGENLFKDIKHSRGFRRAAVQQQNQHTDNPE